MGLHDTPAIQPSTQFTGSPKPSTSDCRNRVLGSLTDDRKIDCDIVGWIG